MPVRFPDESSVITIDRLPVTIVKFIPPRNVPVIGPLPGGGLVVTCFAGVPQPVRINKQTTIRVFMLDIVCSGVIMVKVTEVT